MVSSRHVEEGAGAEYVDRRDTSCDLCGKTVYNGSLRVETNGLTILWKCGACRERDEARWRSMVGEA